MTRFVHMVGVWMITIVAAQPVAALTCAWTCAVAASRAPIAHVHGHHHHHAAAQPTVSVASPALTSTLSCHDAPTTVPGLTSSSAVPTPPAATSPVFGEPDLMAVAVQIGAANGPPPPRTTPLRI